VNPQPVTAVLADDLRRTVKLSHVDAAGRARMVDVGDNR